MPEAFVPEKLVVPINEPDMIGNGNRKRKLTGQIIRHQCVRSILKPVFSAEAEHNAMLLNTCNGRATFNGLQPYSDCQPSGIRTWGFDTTRSIRVTRNFDSVINRSKRLPAPSLKGPER